MRESALPKLLEQKEVIVVGGVGGVGKTTLSAAIALQAALHGRRVAVLTIDPARRLGTALGFRKLGNKLRTTPDVKLDPWRTQKGGKLSAAMLDVKATFDEVVTRFAPSDTIRDRILKNRFYGHLSEALSGTHEYMALEKIYQIRDSGEYDLLILDTPPASAMVDFLAAPGRLRAFLDKEVVRWFFAPERKGLFGVAAATVGKGIGWALSLLDKLAGGKVLEDVAELLANFQHLFEGLQNRAASVERLLHEEKTLFILVTSSDSVPLHKASWMAETLTDNDLHVGAFVLNRTLPAPLELRERGEPWEKDLHTRAQMLVQRQDAVLNSLQSKFPDVPVIEVPLSEEDPSTLDELARLSFDFCAPRKRVR